ncbi:dye decolorizing peroxidase [Murinocardiopsis flavida]|uniref:Dye decolorizing peroxidase n=1 Tax=Murinocardiopsis flavida TaxID=645275 RepID=A0A2P8DRV6_9ACTN|nr:Dyp-type peroxidase [Murinocardiopsis flavida]PSK99941.1 dye decolorizing peroxidase [Murinocardiopsis flavida]
MTDPRHEPTGATPRQPVSRRGLIAGLGAAGFAGVATGGGAGALAAHREAADTEVRARRLAMAGQRSRAHPTLQHGIAGAAPAFVHVVSVDIAADHRTDPRSARSAAQRILRTWTTQARRLHEEGPAAVPSGAAAAGLLPASLMVTVGLGGRLLGAMDMAARRPEALAELPEFGTDDLRAEWCGGELLLQVGAEDPMVLGAAVQHLLSAVAGLVRVRWSLRGFQRTAAAAAEPAATPRNLMGQIDGTANPPQDRALFDTTVSVRAGSAAHGWMRGGSYLVIRRIRMLLDDWYGEDADHRERVLGRRLSNGAPLGRRNEDDPVPPPSARGADGRPVIPADAHVRRSSPENNLGARMFRRGYTYDEGWRPDGTRDAGLLFMAWQADPRRGFVPVQQSLAADDALNAYIRHEGSALFAVPPAPTGDTPIAQALFAP